MGWWMGGLFEELHGNGNLERQRCIEYKGVGGGEL